MTVDDVWSGRLTARHVNALIRGLMTNSDSRVRAHKFGDARWIGFDQTTFAVAAVHDWLAAIALGLGGQKFSKDAGYKIPATPGSTTEDLVAPNVADFNVAGFLRKLHQ